MNPAEQFRVESRAVSDFSKVMRVDRDPLFRYSPTRQTLAVPSGRGGRINLDPDKVKNGLGQLALTIVRLLHELLERQAIRRIDGGTLCDEEIERLGVTLMKQAQEIERLRIEFGLKEEDLNIDLGPLGKLL